MSKDISTGAGIAMGERPDDLVLFKDTNRFSGLLNERLQQLRRFIFILLGLCSLSWYFISFLVAIVITLPLAIMASFWAIRFMAPLWKTPLAIEGGHPWVEGGDDEAAIHILTGSGWKVVPDENLRLVPRQLSREWVLVIEDQGRTEFGLWFDQAASAASRNLQMSLLKEAVALRNMVNGTGQDFESARDREDGEESLLEREWLSTEEGQNEVEFGALLRGVKKQD